MMRLRISQKTYADKILLLIAGIVLLVFNAASIGTEHFLSNLHLLLVGACCILGAVYLLIKPLLLEYDLDYLNVTRGNRTQQISLYNIVVIKKGAFSMNGPTFWKILFINQEGRKRVVYFVPHSTILNEFNEFQLRVQAANPDVVIQT